MTALTLPFLLPYLELRRLGFGPRTLNEVKSFSADVFSYWTSPGESHLWGGLIRAYPKAEGDLFPSFGALILGGVGAGGQRVARVGEGAHPAGGGVADHDADRLDRRCGGRGRTRCSFC